MLLRSRLRGRLRGPFHSRLRGPFHGRMRGRSTVAEPVMFACQGSEWYHLTDMTSFGLDRAGHLPGVSGRLPTGMILEAEGRMILALIGTGNMGQALAKGIIDRQIVPPADVRLYDADHAKCIAFANSIGAVACPDGDTAVREADVILVAVKPQIMDSAIRAILLSIPPQALLISIAAGVTLSHLRQTVGPDLALARVMPNTPAMVGSAVSAVCYDGASAEKQQQVQALLSSCGLVFNLPEKHFDAVTGLSGSGPAYVMLMIESMADAGVRLGLPRDMAIQMAAMTLMGSARMVLETGIHPAVLKDQVCSPGGTTIEAVTRLEEDGLRASLIHAVCAAAEKSKRMREQAGEHG